MPSRIKAHSIYIHFNDILFEQEGTGSVMYEQLTILPTVPPRPAPTFLWKVNNSIASNQQRQQKKKFLGSDFKGLTC